MRVNGHSESHPSRLRDGTLHLAVAQGFSQATEPQGARRFVWGCDSRWRGSVPQVRRWLISISRLAEQDWPINFQVGLDGAGEERGNRSVIGASRFRLLKPDPPPALLVSKSCAPISRAAKFFRSNGASGEQRDHQAIADPECAAQPRAIGVSFAFVDQRQAGFDQPFGQHDAIEIVLRSLQQHQILFDFREPSKVTLWGYAFGGAAHLVDGSRDGDGADPCPEVRQ